MTDFVTPLPRAPLCGGGCGTRLQILAYDWTGRTREQAIAYRLEKSGWTWATPPACIPCQRRKAKGAKR